MGLRGLATLALCLGALAPAGAAPVGSVPLKSFLHGKVESQKGRRVVVSYDFSSPLQLLDFEPANPFVTPGSGAWRLEEGTLVVEGSGAFRWKPVLLPELDVAYRATPKDGRDAGVVLVEPQITSRCIVFALADTFFMKQDRQRLLAHMITCCGVDEPGASGANVFRYVGRSWTPEIRAGEAIDVQLSKRLQRNRMVVGDKTIEGPDIGISLPRIQVALYVLEAGASWSSLRIEAVLDEAWLRENDVAFDPSVDSGAEAPPAREPEPSPGATSAAAEREQVKAWLRTAGDVTAQLAEREKAAQKVMDRKRIADVPYVLMAGLLYSGDENARRLGIDILKAITGKTLGYHQKMDPEQRSEAIYRWWAWIRANRTKIDRDEEGGGR